MSKPALLFLALTFLTPLAFAFTPPQAEWMDIAGTIVVVSFALLFVVTLVLGRKIKFDPVLR